MRVAQARVKNPTTASLFVAYMLVLQSLALGFVAPGAFRGRLFASEICLSGTPAAEEQSSPAQGNPSGGHLGDQCCVYHHAGAGGPPAQGVELQRSAFYDARIEWLTPSQRVRTLWPTLPVGSRAPPPETSRDWA